jgi:hypothetical protein
MKLPSVLLSRNRRALEMPGGVGHTRHGRGGAAREEGADLFGDGGLHDGVWWDGMRAPIWL